MAETLKGIDLSQAKELKLASSDISEKMSEFSSYGRLDQSIVNFMRNMDRFHNSNYLPAMLEQTGNVFISRPELNLSTPNLALNRIMAPLNTLNPMSNAFMIRCLLDTQFTKKNRDIVGNSPLLDLHNPWFTPLCNGIVGISGWPDFTVETEGTEGGYFSENQTYVVGSDNLNRTYNFNITFKDIPSSPVFSAIFYWLHYMASVTLGDMKAYSFNIDQRVLDYTVSFYQFVMDPTRRYILKTAKATGCFPVSFPMGDIFSFSEGSMLSQGSGKFSIPFIVNNVKYNDYLRIIDFNIYAQRWCKDIASAPIIKFGSPYNYVGLPFIVSSPKGFIMTYRDVNKVLGNDCYESESTTSELMVPSMSAYLAAKEKVVPAKNIDDTGILDYIRNLLHRTK